MGLNAQDVKVELHSFCDAPVKAYAVIAYLRIISNDIIVSLVASNTRVAPIKELILPKLELNQTLISEMIVAIKNSVNFSIHGIFLWCHSYIIIF